ncbi:MAG TPA: hypothetical protein VES20_20485, partial [Bryobacteraceae bacterium]|nr:hypothetical protein [Bryobacteraceae bacterium]
HRSMPPRRVLFGLWYFAIAFGFALLAVSSAIRGGARWAIILRIIVAVGFMLLAIAHLRTRPR